MKTKHKKAIHRLADAKRGVQSRGFIRLADKAGAKGRSTVRHVSSIDGRLLRTTRNQVRFFKDAKAACIKGSDAHRSVFVPIGSYEPGKFKGLDDLRRKYNLDDE